MSIQFGKLYVNMAKTLWIVPSHIEGDTLHYKCTGTTLHQCFLGNDTMLVSRFQSLRFRECEEKSC